MLPCNIFMSLKVSIPVSMNKNIMETSTLNCYVFLIVKHFGRVQDKLVNAISETHSRKWKNSLTN